MRFIFQQCAPLVSALERAAFSRLRWLVLAVMIIAGGFLASPATPEAQAFDPISMAILSPVAANTAQTVLPMLIRGAVNSLQEVVYIGIEVIQLMRLPFGIVQLVALSPFGYFSDSIYNITRGALAPANMLLCLAYIPVRFLQGAQ